LAAPLRHRQDDSATLLGRANEEFVEYLFRQEVPEMETGAVEIKAIAREAGHRTKISVKSTEDGIDPVGSCVGQKGVRVQAVINELNGEKIDIVEYSNNLVEYVKAALAPAEGFEVNIDESKRKVTVTVPDDQLSLAIGRGGQNARLAAKLLGFKVDIKGVTEGSVHSVTGDEEFEIDKLGLGSKVRNTLLDLKITTVKELEAKLESLKATIDELDPRAYVETGKAIARFYKKADMAKEEAEKAARFAAERAAEQR
jgi:transcription antitermination factor NusA-like protein